MHTIQSVVRNEIRSFIENPVTIVEGYSFNQYENVKKTHLYTNGQFASQIGQQSNIIGESEEDDRIFFQITTPRIKAVKRFFDIDTADILLDEIDPQSEIALQLLNRDFDRFCNEFNVAKTLNDMTEMLITYGSLVLKIGRDGEPKIVNLQDYFVDPTVARSADSRFNTIKHVMTPRMLRDKVKEGWDADAVEAIIARAGTKSDAKNTYEDDESRNQIVSSPQIEVYERYGSLETWQIDGGADTTEIDTLTITAEPLATSTRLNEDGSTTTDEDGEVLYKARWTADLPIVDHHLVKTVGRWQGIGITELLYPVQQRMNEVANQKRISMEISALHLFQTADPGVLNNILNDLENGDVIKTKVQGSLAPLVNEERNLPAFQSEEITYQTHGDKLSFANDLLTAGDVPSSTPATNVVVQNNNQVLVHLQDRENFANFVGDQYIKPHVVPTLIKEFKDEHFLRLIAEPEDALHLEDKIIQMQLDREMIERPLRKGGSLVSVLDQDDLREEMTRKLQRSGPNRYVKVLQGYYEKKISDVIVLIDNEKKDTAKVAGNTLSFFQMIQDPSVLSDPVNRLFVTEWGKEIGIDTAKMNMAFARREAQPQQEAPAGKTKIPEQKETKEDPALANVL